MDSSPAQEGSFVSVHTDITLRILAYLPLRDRLTFAKVCLEWKSFICNLPHIWKNISIDWSSPFGDEWKPTNELVNAGYLIRSDPASHNKFHKSKWTPRLLRDIELYRIAREKQQGTMEAFILDLANATDLIEHFSITTAINECPIPPKPIYTLLMRQKRIISLNLCLHERSERYESMTCDALDEVCGWESPEACILKVIGKHQGTLEQLKLPSNASITLKNWAGLLSTAKFPNLRTISFPCFYYCRAGQMNSVAEFKSVMTSFINQLLKYGNVEEINMSMYDFQPADKWKWPKAVREALRSAIERGLIPKLKKVHLNCLLRPIEASSILAIDILMRNCLELTHLHGYFPDAVHDAEDQPVTQKSPFPQLTTYYSKNLFSLECIMYDSLAEIIVQQCSNIKTLIAQEHYNTYEDEWPQFSDRGLLLLSNLRKLENFCLMININQDPEISADGVVKCLSSLITGLRKLTLILPCHFFNEEGMYEVISKGNASLKNLSLELSSVNPGSTLNGAVLKEGLCKVIEKCYPLDHLSVHACCSYSIEPDFSMIRAVFCSVINFQESLKSFSFKIWSSIDQTDREFIIRSLPYCKIDVDRFSERFLAQ